MAGLEPAKPALRAGALPLELQAQGLHLGPASMSWRSLFSFVSIATIRTEPKGVKWPPGTRL